MRWRTSLLKLRYHSEFKKSLKLMQKQGKNMSLLKDILTLLVEGRSLPPKNKDHALKNSRLYHEVRECHIEPDWLLVYRVNGDILELIATGSHSNLFS